MRVTKPGNWISGLSISRLYLPKATESIYGNMTDPTYDHAGEFPGKSEVLFSGPESDEICRLETIHQRINRVNRA